MREAQNAAFIVAAAILWAVVINNYFSPYNQCVRAETQIREWRGVKDGAKQAAQVYCTEALGGGSHL